MQQSTTKVTSMAKNVVAMTARARETMKAARAMAAGATRTVATTVATTATMTPNVDKDNKDGNSKNNNKVTTTLTATTTTEGEERPQSCRDNHGGGHRYPRYTAAAPTSASS